MTRQFQIALDGTVQNVFTILSTTYLAEYSTKSDLFIPNLVSYVMLESDSTNAANSTIKFFDDAAGGNGPGRTLAPGDYDPMGPFDNNIVDLKGLYVQASANGIKMNIQIVSR